MATRPNVPSTDEWKLWVDSDLAGEAPEDTKSRTGAIFTLNKMPVHWRSNRHPKTVFSSAAAEVFAFSEAVKDARLLLWRAEELSVKVRYPFTMLKIMLLQFHFKSLLLHTQNFVVYMYTT